MGLRLVLVLLALVAAVDAALLLTSNAFKNFEEIPHHYGCTEARSIQVVPSPPLQWVRLPALTQSLVLLVDDMDNGGAVHWIVKDIPITVKGFDEDASVVQLPEGSQELPNSFGDTLFSGFCPPEYSSHSYRFRLFARDIPSTNLQYPPPISGFNITAELYERQLDDGHTLYCAVLVGKYSLGKDLPPIPVGNDTTVPMTKSTGPTPVVRFTKPSETLRHRRPHYNPRPYGDYPYNTTAFCERRRAAGSMDSVYASVCNATRPGVPNAIVPQQIESGGFELPDLSATLVPPNPLYSTGGIPSRTFDMTKLPSAKPWTVDPVSGLPVPPAPDTVMALQSASTVRDARQSQLPVLLSPVSASLIDWTCGDVAPEPLTIRSPVSDSCLDSKPVVGTLPSEFSCDLSNQLEMSQRLSGQFLTVEPTIVSPPLVWRIQDTSQVKSFVLMIDDAVSKRIHWLVGDIPGETRELPLGASNSEGLSHAREVDNSFGVHGYVPPCSVIARNGPPGEGGLLRVRLYAMPDATTLLPKRSLANSDALDSMLRDSSLYTAELKWNRATVL